VTIASVAALILGAALLYVTRWADERSLLSAVDGGGAGSGGEYEPLQGVPSTGGPDGGVEQRPSLFARSGGAAAALLGGPPSPGSIPAAAQAEEEAAAGAGGGGGRGVVGAINRLLGRARGPPRGTAAAAPVGGGEGLPAMAPLPAAAGTRAAAVAVPWRTDQR
jgi:hypothetical protein